jgi:transcriptional regulator with XRE-family HTH domain
MKEIADYLDEAIRKGIAKNDAQLATRLSTTTATISRWRSGERAPDDKHAMNMAKKLGLDEAEMLAAAAAARAKDPAVKAAWERVVKSFAIAGSAAALVIAASTLFMTVPENAHAKTMTYGDKEQEINIIANALRGLWGRIKRRILETFEGLAGTLTQPTGNPAA